MKTVRTLSAARTTLRAWRRAGKTVGFVPTMGAFHAGHLSLIQKARQESDKVVVSIFVNPTQFNQKSDFTRYPRTLARDRKLATQEKVDLLIVPTAAALYPEGFQTTVTVPALSRRWEGQRRPGHLPGVATIVTKLFCLVQPTTVYFGQKDAQQARVVRQLIQDLNFDIRLKVLPTVREADGLAMSSRNKRLSSSARRSSRNLFAALQEGKRLIEWGESRAAQVLRVVRKRLKTTPGLRVDYLALVNPESLEPVNSIRGEVWLLAAVWAGKIRLIDGCVVRRRRKR